MRFELLVGLNVVDDETYSAYRKAISPILARYGGGFGYDFRVSETLKTESVQPINRIFTIFFPSKEVKNEFFSNDDYLKIKSQFFAKSVDATTIIAEYRR